MSRSPSANYLGWGRESTQNENGESHTAFPVLTVDERSNK